MFEKRILCSKMHFFRFPVSEKKCNTQSRIPPPPPPIFNFDTPPTANSHKTNWIKFGIRRTKERQARNAHLLAPNFIISYGKRQGFAASSFFPFCVSELIIPRSHNDHCIFFPSAESSNWSKTKEKEEEDHNDDVASARGEERKEGMTPR